jgi:predicted metal-dependent phosphoesterase TrpH
VIPGQEVLTRQGEVIGLYLVEDIPSGLTLDQAVAAIRAQGGLVYLPHPYDSMRHATVRRGALERAADLADIVEVENGRSLCRRYDRLSRQLAVRHGKVLGAGSDAHYPGESGRAVLELERSTASDDLPVGLTAGPPAPNDLLALLRDARLVRSDDLSDRLLAWWFLTRVGVDKLRRRFARASKG